MSKGQRSYIMNTEYPCSKCGTMFMTASSRRNHEKSFKCSIVCFESDNSNCSDMDISSLEQSGVQELESTPQPIVPDSFGDWPSGLMLVEDPNDGVHQEVEIKTDWFPQPNNQLISSQNVGDVRLQNMKISGRNLPLYTSGTDSANWFPDYLPELFPTEENSLDSFLKENGTSSEELFQVCSEVLSPLELDLGSKASLSSSVVDITLEDKQPTGELCNGFQPATEVPAEIEYVSSNVYVGENSSSFSIPTGGSCQMTLTELMTEPLPDETNIEPLLEETNVVDFTTFETLSSSNKTPAIPPKRGRGRPRKIKETAKMKDINFNIPNDDNTFAYLRPMRQSKLICQQKIRRSKEFIVESSDDEYIPVDEFFSKEKGRGRVPQSIQGDDGSSESSDCYSSVSGKIEDDVEKRRKNNVASKKSRDKRKSKDKELEIEKEQLQRKCNYYVKIAGELEKALELVMVVAFNHKRF